MHGPVHHKLAFGTIPPANVLKYEYVAVGEHVRITVKLGAESFIVGGDSVRCALQKNRQRLPGILRRVNLGMQLHAVPHGDHRFFLLE